MGPFDFTFQITRPENRLSSADTTKLFGTDGIRAEAGKFPLDAATIRIIGASLAEHLKAQTGRTPRIIVGRDTRESGEWISRELIIATREAGADTRSAGIITTPGVAFLTRNLPADGGVVISASHNVYQDNGIKIFDPSGRKLDETVERRIEMDVADAAKRYGIDGTVQPNDQPQSDEPGVIALQERYLDFLINEVARDLSLDKLSIVVDCANGAAYKLAPKLLARLGAQVHAINIEPNGRNINLNCGSLHLESLQVRVGEVKADLGVAFDGDADRALFVDAKGKIVDGDATLWILGNYLKSRGELSGNKIVATGMSNIGLELALRERGIELVRTDVGDKYVLDELLRSGASLGGEQSGHIILPRISLAGDGMLTTLCLLRALREQHQSLDALAAGFQRYPQLLVNVRVLEKVPFEKLAAIQQLARQIEEQFRGRGRLLLRYSGTEPLARIMLEGESEREIKTAAADLAQVIQRELGAAN